MPNRRRATPRPAGETAPAPALRVVRPPRARRERQRGLPFPMDLVGADRDPSLVRIDRPGTYQVRVEWAEGGVRVSLDRVSSD